MGKFNAPPSTVDSELLSESSFQLVGDLAEITNEDYQLAEQVAETYKNNEDATSLTLSGVNPDSFTRLLHSTPTPVALISDDQGNVFALLNQNTRKLATAAFLMQLVHLLYDRGAQLAPNHCKRDHNQWADELTHPAPVGFTPEKRLSLQSILLLPLQDWKTPSL